MDNVILLIGIAFLILAIILFMCKSCSKFGGDATTIKPTISKDSTIIFHMPGCGHCVNAMPEFQEAIKNGNGKIHLVDGTDSENEKLVSNLNVKGFPTIIKGDGTQYTGSRKADEIVKFSKE